MAKTIKQIADELGVSKQAVHQKRKSKELSTRLQSFTSTVDGVVYISINGEKLIKQAFIKHDRKHVDDNEPSTVDGVVYSAVDGEKPIKQAFIKHDRKHVDDNEPSTVDGVVYSAVDGEKSVLLSAFHLLEKQNEQLSSELTIKNKQIDDLNSRLAESNAALVAAQQTAQAAQALHAGTMQKQITDGQKEDNPMKKKWFWQK